MSNVTQIKTERPAEVIASSLRVMADRIEKEGTATRVILVIAEREPGQDKQSMILFGADASVTELVGMLEIAKVNAVTSE